MGKTLANLRIEVRRYINEETANQWTDAELTDYINDGQEYLMGEIVRVNPDYMLIRATTPSVSSQKDYATPADMFGNKFRNLCVSLSGGISTDVALASVDKIQSMRNQYGTPKFYAMVRDSFIVAPAPESAAYTFELWYTPYPTALVGESDQTVYNSEETNVVTLSAAVRALDRFGMPGTDRLNAALKSAVDQLLLNIQPDDKVGVEFVPLDMT
jgi:hypothetical protein